jgi:hypothetical protein
MSYAHWKAHIRDCGVEGVIYGQTWWREGGSDVACT